MPGKGLVIDVPIVEGGTMVLSDKADRIDVFQASRWEDLHDIEQYLRYESHGYSWVGVDTITATQVLAVRKTIHERELSADAHIISMPEWGKVGELAGEFYLRFRQLPLHVIFLAQEQMRDGEGGMPEYQPSISPGSLLKLQPAMFLMGRLYTREVESATPGGHEVSVERRLRVGPHQGAMTKVRALPGRSLPAVIRNPDLGRIFAYILGVSDERPEAAIEATTPTVEFSIT